MCQRGSIPSGSYGRESTFTWLFQLWTPTANPSVHSPDLDPHIQVCGILKFLSLWLCYCSLSFIRIPWLHWGLPWWLSGKGSSCQCRRCEFDPPVRKVPWSRKWQPLQYSCLENPMARGSSVQFSSVAQSCPTLCDPMNRSMPGLPVHHQLPEFTQTNVHRVSEAIHPSYPLSSPSPPAPNPSQHQSLFQWVNSSHEVAKVLEFQL